MKMAEVEGENEGLPPRMINVELARVVIEKIVENTSMKREIERLKGRMDRREEEDSGHEDDGDNDETPRQEEESIPIEQRPLLNSLKSMEWRTMDGN